MIAKGLDFPDVTVVGVLGTDLMLASSSCRTSRHFSLSLGLQDVPVAAIIPSVIYSKFFNPDLPLFKFACSPGLYVVLGLKYRTKAKLQLPAIQKLAKWFSSLGG